MSLLALHTYESWKQTDSWQTGQMFWLADWHGDAWLLITFLFHILIQMNPVGLIHRPCVLMCNGEAYLPVRLPFVLERILFAWVSNQMFWLSDAHAVAWLPESVVRSWRGSACPPVRGWRRGFPGPARTCWTCCKSITPLISQPKIWQINASVHNSDTVYIYTYMCVKVIHFLNILFR